MSDNATDVDRQRGKEAVLPVLNSEHAISGTAHPSERLAVVDHGPCQNAGAMNAQDSDLRHTDVLPPCLRSLSLSLSLALALASRPTSKKIFALFSFLARKREKVVAMMNLNC